MYLIIWRIWIKTWIKPGLYIDCAELALQFMGMWSIITRDIRQMRYVFLFLLFVTRISHK